MDRVRLGRVLGRGARMAARTVYEAVDAATTPSQAQPGTPEPGTRTASLTAGRADAANARTQIVAAARSGSRVADSQRRSAPASGTGVRDGVQRTIDTAGRVHGSVRAAREGVLGPVKRASRAVSLEISGSFFALFALSFGAAAWRFRSTLALGSAGQRFWLYVVFAALFGYFAVSSFVRARRLSR